MIAESPVQTALERWRVARDSLANFEANYLTLLLVSVESDAPVPVPLIDDSVLTAWRATEAEVHAAYADLLDTLNSASPALSQN